MFKNYFYLVRTVFELNQQLENSIIRDIYSQEKDILYFSIPSDSLPNRHLIISTNAQFPYLLIKDNHHKAKKNVVQFLKDFHPISLNDISISDSDRVIKFNLNIGKIIFTIRGSKTNIYFLIDNNNDLSFKKSDNEITSEINDLNFITNLDFNKLKQDNLEYESIIELKKNYPMISSEIKNEILLIYDNHNIIKEIFDDTIKKIFHSSIRVGYNYDLQKVIFVPDNFESLKTDNNSQVFTKVNKALNYYISSYYKLHSKTSITKELDKYFEKELASLANKLNKLKMRIEKGSNEELYYSYGNLLLTNIYQIKKGMKNIELNSYSDNSLVSIKLDPKLQPKNNIDKYFEKAKDEKINYSKSLELFKIAEKNYLFLKEENDKYINAETIDDIKKIYTKVIPKKTAIVKMDSGLKFKYWHYVINDMYHVYIGRDSKSNDYLSIKFAKQNDYWFHARGLPGSHVVMRVDNVKVGIPKDILKKGASLAAYYSKAKTAGTAPVSYTFAKFVYKKKGMLPGQVLLKKENVLLVKPGVPKNCELINE